VKAALLCFFLLVTVILTACGPGQNKGHRQLSVTAVSTIKNGVTTKRQVLDLFGNPNTSKRQLATRQSPNAPSLPTKYLASEIWGYWTDSNDSSSFSSFFSSNAKQQRYLVIIFFDERGIVMDCETETYEK
jgi:hypothetical protein